MKSYNFKQVKEIFKILKDKDTLLIHSALQNLGRLEGEEFSRIPQVFRDFCLDLSARNTLIVPTFNYDFPKTHYCDLREQKSVIGILNESLRKVAKYRSNHPMFNFVGFGENAQAILSANTLENNPFSKDSVYSRLKEQNALMLFLGIDIRVCTFVVYVEAMCGVKYRFFKPFLGEIITMESERFQTEFYHFCRPMDDGAKVSYVRLLKELLANGILQFFPLGASGIYVLRTQELFSFLQNRLKEEPFFLLTNPPKAYYCYDKEAQVESLEREDFSGGGGGFNRSLYSFNKLLFLHYSK